MDTLSGIATLFSATPWTSGFLDAYLGDQRQSGQPNRRVSGVDTRARSGRTGSFVFQVDLGMTTLQGASPARTHKSIAIVFGNRWLPQNDVCVVPEAQTSF
jgi:hypothetical protein